MTEGCDDPATPSRDGDTALVQISGRRHSAVERHERIKELLAPAPNARHSRAAERFIRDGIIDSRSGRGIPIGDSLWASGPQSDRTWLWTLHSYQPLDPLIAQGEGEILDALIRSWRVRFEDVPVEEDFPWHDHATALRLDRLSQIGIMMPELIYTELAARHANLLLEDGFYSKHTNHGFDQATSLIRAALVFHNHPSKERWREVGLLRLKDEIGFAFTGEGVHVENSPAYHVGMINNLVRARNLLQLADEEGDAEFGELYDRALCFAAWATRPDRWLCYLGDSQSYRANVPAELAELPSYPMLRWAMSGGREGEAPSENTAIYEKSGYAFYRSRWKPWHGQVYIAMKCGFLSRYHRQDDDLNILVHAYGQDWLIDSGLYNHNPKDPVRIYMRSALAHNVPYLEGVSTNRTSPGPDRATLVRLQEDEFEFAVEGVTRMFSGATVKRKLLIRGEEEFLVRDRVDIAKKVPIYWLFHVPADKHVSVSPGIAAIKGNGAVLAIRSSDKHLSCALHTGFDAPFPSVVSRETNKYEASQVVVFGPTHSSSQSFRCTFRKT